jgi:mannosyl-oligosaccharide glucosidase
MWVDPLRPDALTNIRHQAEMRDGLSKYGWLAHDGEGFGRQGILDEGLNITTSWIKNNSTFSSSSSDDLDSSSHSSYSSNSWSARVAAQARQGYSTTNNQESQPSEEEESATAISFFVYLATEDGSPIKLRTSHLSQTVVKFDANRVVMSGNTHAIGKWKLYFNIPSTSGGATTTATPGAAEKDTNDDDISESLKPPSIVETSFMGIKTPHLHNLTESVHQGLIRSLYAQHEAGKEYRTLSLPNQIDPGSNVVVVQITAMLPTAIDVSFTTTYTSSTDSSSTTSNEIVVGGALTSSLEVAESAFSTRFEKTFGKLTTSSGTTEAARAALSNLLGGMGYWYGHSLVKLKNLKNPKKVLEHTEISETQILKMWDTPLYSATPSRSFFPRGFLWDEGFHQLLIQKWNSALSRDALAHWLDLMTTSGWIPREQILGEEARARVPSEFIPQSPDAANPPALFLPLAEIAGRVITTQAREIKGSNNNSDIINDVEFLKAAWPRLRTWFLWYNQSQAGPVAGSFRWRGRVENGDTELNPKTLTSGLDDYPRASHPSSEERHLDLRCWMALAAHSLSNVGAAVGAPKTEIEEFRAFARRLDDFEELKELHWDEKRQIFADWGLHTEDVELIPENNNNGGGSGSLKRRTSSPPQLQYVPHYGYLSLFPLIMNLIPKDSPILGQQIANLQKESELWTPFGLRSLSKSSSLYNKHNTQHDPPYWRGPIWINVNYLVLRALRRYEHQGGPYSKQAKHAADALRTALVSNLAEQYNTRGYLYEQYDDETGNGKGCHPFTGWTALLTLIAGEE